MSFLDKIIGAITPPESDERRLRVRAETTPGDWLSMILDHHDRIEAAFTEVKSASDVSTRRAAQKHLAVLLIGHSGAEETVLYPEMVDTKHKAHAGVAYQ